MDLCKQFGVSNYEIFVFLGQITSGNFMPNVIPITESHQQEFIVNLTEDGQQQMSESEQPQTIMHPEVTFHNITGKVTQCSLVYFVINEQLN